MEDKTQPIGREQKQNIRETEVEQNENEGRKRKKIHITHYGTVITKGVLEGAKRDKSEEFVREGGR